jgi:hypothetical protein
MFRLPDKDNLFGGISIAMINPLVVFFEMLRLAEFKCSQAEMLFFFGFWVIVQWLSLPISIGNQKQTSSSF